MSDTPDPLLDVIARIAEGQPVDWAALEALAGTESFRQQLAELKVIAGVADLARETPAGLGASAQQGAEAAPTWAHLRILEQVGRGAFGEVYRAWDTKLDREVALKLLHAPADERQRRTPTIEEGRLLARIRHPNVVTVYGADRIGDSTGIWMEFVRGRTLEQLLRDGGPLQTDTIVRTGIDLLQALTAVHGAGLLHRDIKAQNVVREDGGRLVLMDFGSVVDRDNQRTGDGSLAGTPLYLAPEVMAGGPPTALSDIYAVGVLLYHLATGDFPIRAATFDEVRQAVGTGNVAALADIRPELPSGLVEAINRAMQHTALERFQSAGEMLAALKALAPEARRSGSSPLAGVAVFAASALVAAWMAGLIPGTATGPWTERQPTPGPATLELTIDIELQRLVEREVAQGVLDHRADGATGIVMAPFTGEVLALANAPTVSADDSDRSPQAFWRNLTVRDVYEPGSTFKIITASAALDEELVHRTDVIDTTPGYVILRGRRRVVDAVPRGSLTLEDIILKSSNVGAIKVGQLLGAERMGQFIQRFGLGQVLEPNLPLQFQSAGIVPPVSSLDEAYLGSVSMGYQIAVTTLQMASVVSVIANGGVLMEPHVVRAVNLNGTREETQPRELRRVIRPETAATVRTFMEGVVERGAGRRARMEHFQVAGQGGTAAKIVDGRYSNTDYTGLFVGFVPSRHPVYTIVVAVDTPRGDVRLAGSVAASVFRRIAEAALRTVGTKSDGGPRRAVVVAVDSPEMSPPGGAAMEAIPLITAARSRSSIHFPWEARFW